jgi:Fe-S-cluster-containing hydrogenase component 2
MHEGDFNPGKSRIMTVIFRGETYPLPYNFPFTCKQCADAPCLMACPVGAITRAKDDMKTVTIDDETCIKCGTCVAVCPFGAMFFDMEKKIPYKCDLCRGDPACASICPTGAISFKNQRPFYSKPQSLSMTAFTMASEQNRKDFRQAKKRKR